MGFKVRAGIAMAGVLLSWGFGLNFLSGLAGTVDSAGHIMVDIADGIGLLSKGIEAIEGYIDPHKPETPDVTSEETPPGASDTVSEAIPPPVLCKKGKCTPYDPAKDKVLQQQLIQKEREKILKGDASVQDINIQPTVTSTRKKPSKFATTTVASTFSKPSKYASTTIASSSPKSFKYATTTPAIKSKRNNRYDDDDDDDDDDDVEPVRGSSHIGEGDISSPEVILQTPESSIEETPTPSSWRVGTKKALNKTAELCGKVSTLILKVVNKIFPWNRRARRRLSGEEDSDDGA